MTTVPGVWGGGEVRELGWWLVGKGMVTAAADVDRGCDALVILQSTPVQIGRAHV